MNKAVIVAFPQQFHSLVMGELACHAMLHGPPAQSTCVETGFQYMIAGVTWVDEPLRETAWAGGDAPVACVFDSFGQILRGKGITR